MGTGHLSAPVLGGSQGTMGASMQCHLRTAALDGLRAGSFMELLDWLGTWLLSSQHGSLYGVLLELEGRQQCTVAQGLLYLMTFRQAVLWNCLSGLKLSCCQGTMGGTMEGHMGSDLGVLLECFSTWWVEDRQLFRLTHQAWWVEGRHLVILRALYLMTFRQVVGHLETFMVWYLVTDKAGWEDLGSDA